jgi:hypothetical protein
MAAETTPLGLCAAEALRRHPALDALRRRMADSNARLACIAPCLPTALRAQVQAGPLDDDGWSLLAANAAVAAKLRHLLPTLHDTLRAQGWQATAIRVRLQAPR